jgi:hypothetical protein
MQNKLIILSFAIFLCGACLAQDRSAFSDNEKISIYPNPAVEHVIVQLGDGFVNAKFELNSMIGNKIYIQPEEMGGGKYKIPVKNLATGYYFLIVKDEDKRFKKAYKFLKH